MGIPRTPIRPMFKKDKWKILRGDTVMITAGKEKGKIGTVSRVIRDVKKPKVVVEGLNLRQRINKASQDQKGSIISVEGPMAYSNVQLVDPTSKQPVRVTWRFTEDGSKVRETRGPHATSSILSRPEVLVERRKPAPLPGARDTGLTEVLKETHAAGDWPSALSQMRYSSSAWCTVVGSIYTKRRATTTCSSISHGFAASSLL